MPYVTPIVRKLAHDLGVDLAHVSGTGVGGRIRKEDILAAAGASKESEVGHLCHMAAHIYMQLGGTCPFAVRSAFCNYYQRIGCLLLLFVVVRNIVDTTAAYG